jgi:uncharacterized integral membrane protein
MSAAPETHARTRLSPSRIVAAVLAGLLILFAALNSQSVTVHWIVTTTSAPLFVVIAGCGLVGFAAGYLTARHTARARRPR